MPNTPFVPSITTKSDQTSLDVQLFDKPECPFCWKVRAALWVKGLNYRGISVDTDNKPPELLALNTKGTVPVLVTPAAVIDESSAIITWLEQHAVRPTLRNPNANALEQFSDKTIGPRIREQIFMRRNLPETEWESAVTERCQANWVNTLEDLEDRCSGQGQWFLGESITIADCALGPRFALATYYGLSGVTHYPKIARWFEHFLASPLFTATAPEHIAIALHRQLPIRN